MGIDGININNNSIKWKELTAKEILKYKDEGNDVPVEYQSWAAAIAASLNVKDDVTYEMVNGSTDIATLEEAFGTGLAKREVQAKDEAENNMDENQDNNDKQVQILETQFDAEQKDETIQEDVTLADQNLLTDPNEIIKRNLRKGKPLP